MCEPKNWPISFRDLSSSPPDGCALSDRILDAEVLLDRADGRITARLVGVRTIMGRRRILYAPSCDHAWVPDGGTLRPLPGDAPQVFRAMLDGFEPEDLPFKKAADLLRDHSAILPVSATDRFQASGTEAAEPLPESVEIPGLEATLYPYQAKGVQWMRGTLNTTRGLILADEMGLGKTLQVIALFLLDEPQEASPALVVCPTSLITNWVREIRKFGPSLSVHVHRGSSRTGVFRGLQQSNVVITTYDTMVNDIAIFSAFEWSWVICDEAQAIKNPDSNRRRAIASIPRKKTIPMTGTPVENTLLDLWSLMDFPLCQGSCPSLYLFSIFQVGGIG